MLLGTKLQTLLTIGSRIYYETHYAQLLRMQGFAYEIALEVVRDDGRILPVLVNSRQKRDAGGAPLFNRITLFDSTGRRRYEEGSTFSFDGLLPLPPPQTKDAGTSLAGSGPATE